jgi:formate dehydrogenase subunit delta
MNVEKLARMANQIAANFDYGPSGMEKSVAGVVDHLRRFWTPVMLEELASAHRAGQVDLAEAAETAIERLAEERRSSAA